MPYVRACRLAILGQEEAEMRVVLDGFLANVSELGVYVTVDPPPDVGRTVQISFALAEGETAVEVPATVVWRNLPGATALAYGLPQGCGLRFTALGKAGRERIRSLVDEYSSALRGEGLTVVCAACGRIRLGGAWQRGERLKETAHLTHGICPECATKLYPDEVTRIRSRHGERDDSVPPEDAKGWYNLGVTYAVRRQHAAAVSAYREAIAGDPAFAEAWYNLGMAHGNQGQHAEAARAFREAVRLRPDYVKAWFNLGVTCAIESDQGGVIAAYERLKALDLAKAEEFFTTVLDFDSYD